MDLVKPGYEVLYIWRDQNIEEIEQQVNELKATANVRLENSERLSFASYNKSSFDVILVNVNLSTATLDNDSVKLLLNLVKPKGKVVFNSPRNDELQALLVLSGFINVMHDEAKNYIVSEKPNYEVGSAAKLSFAKKPAAVANKVWKLDVDDDDEIIDADELLDEEDKKIPSSESLRVCSTTGKRKACKDCSCGLAEELEAEVKGNSIDPNPTQKSSCGSCYLGDAFRCSTCPYLGLPAFKPGEKIQLTDMMKSDV